MKGFGLYFVVDSKFCQQQMVNGIVQKPKNLSGSSSNVICSCSNDLSIKPHFFQIVIQLMYFIQAYILNGHYKLDRPTSLIFRIFFLSFVISYLYIYNVICFISLFNKNYATFILFWKNCYSSPIAVTFSLFVFEAVAICNCFSNL